MIFLVAHTFKKAAFLKPAARSGLLLTTNCTHTSLSDYM